METTNQSTSILATRFNSDGQKIYQKTVEVGGLGDEVSVATDADGDAVVAYGYDVDQTAPGDEIYFKRIAKDGTVGSRTFVAKRTTTDEDESVRSPAVAMDDSGRFYLAYVHDLGNRSEHDLQMRFYDAAGNLQGSEFSANVFKWAFSHLHGIDLAATSDGSRAVWGTAIDISDDFQTLINTGRVSASEAVGGVQLVDTMTGPAHSALTPIVRVVANDDGSSVVAFDTEAGSFAQRYDDLGNAVGDLISLGSGKRPAIAVTPGGGFVVLLDEIATSYTDTGFVDSQPQGVGGGLNNNIGTDNAGNLILTYNKADNGPVYFRSYASGAPAPFAMLSGTRLFVDGTAAADFINISRIGGDYVIERGNSSLSFVVSTVASVSVHGFGGDDSIVNDTDLASTINGDDGADTIFGGTAADRVYGGYGADEIWGGDGPDNLWGLDGNDSIYGNGGNDRIEGGAQPDHIRGNGGRDRILGNGGNDHIFGGSSGDYLYGGPGADQLIGEGGNDRLYGDDGEPDKLWGGAGDDTFITLDGVVDQLFGDGGRDNATPDNADSSDIFVSIEVR
jgi:Ca2+-binding RTX toxin-like protein